MPVKDLRSAKEKMNINLQDMLHDVPLAHLSLPSLDEIMGGVKPGRVVILCGEPGSGKTTLLNQITDDLARQGHIILYFSYEIAEHQLMAKSISRLSNRALPTDKIAGCQDDPRLNQALMEAATKYDDIAPNIFYFDDPSIDALEIGALVGKCEREFGQKPIVMVDYVQRVPSHEEKLMNDERLQIKSVVESLRRCANNYDIPVFCVSSISREHYDKPITGLKALGGCAYLEYSADSVLLLSVEGKGEERKANLELSERPILISSLKNRYSNMSTAHLCFDAPFATFTEREPRSWRMR